MITMIDRVKKAITEVDRRVVAKTAAGSILIVLGFNLINYPDMAKIIGANNGWSFGAVYWFRTLMISLCIVFWTIGVSLFFVSRKARWWVAILGVIMLMSAPGIWTGLHNHPFARYPMGDDGVRPALVDNYARVYPEIMSIRAGGLPWVLAFQENDPHRNGGLTLMEAITQTVHAIEANASAQTNKFLESSARNGHRSR